MPSCAPRSRRPARRELIDEAGNQWFTLRGCVRAGARDRRAHGLGAERRLARRLPERAGRRRGAAPARRGGHAAADGAARLLGRRGRRPVRTLAVRLVGRGGLDARPGRAAHADGSRRRRIAGRACASTASISTARSRRASQLEGVEAYLELHIEQGPVLESLDLPLGVVLGTFGVERSRFTWRGQAAHAGSTPMDKRRDALAGAAKLALYIREIAAEVGGGAVCTSGGVVTQAGHRHIGRRDRRAAARPAPSRRRVARAHAADGAGRGRPLRRGGEHRGRVGADLEHRADPVRRGADRTRRRGGARDVGHVAQAAVRARCTTRPRSHAPGSRR